MTSSRQKVLEGARSLRLGDLLEEFDERLGSRPEPEILTLTEKMGFVAQRERFNKRLAVADTSNYKVIGLYDIAFNPYLLWAGAIAQNTAWKAAIISPLYPTFRVRGGYSPRFVNHLLCGGVLRPLYDAISHGSVPRKRRSTVTDFLNLEIHMPVPPFPEQEQIVKLLDEADELRKLRAQADHHTAALIPALFHQMFGDTEHSQRSLPLGELVREFRYGTSNKSSGDGKPTLRIPNVVGQAVNLDGLKFVPVSKVEFERLRLIDGDLLFVRTNGNPDNVGRCATFEAQTIKATRHDPSDFIFASYLIRARLQTEKVLPLFVQRYLASPTGRRALRERSKTSAGQFNINTAGLGTIPVPVPPMPLQKEFVERVTAIRALETAQSTSRTRLDALFQSMLHRAFNGEL